MYFKLDHFGKIKCPKLSLRLSGGSGLGVLKLGDKLPDCDLNANDISTFKFTIYEKLDGKTVQYYDLVEIDKIIETDYIGVYRITDVDENRNGKVAYKEVTVKSLECELQQRKIFSISGVYSLYNVADTDYSLMHIICKSLGNWSIGHIDNELTSLYRTFDINSVDAYSLMTETISASFKCVFQFDTYNRKINVVTIDNFGEKVDILLSYRNLVQQNIITSSLADVFTIFKVSGGNDLTIRDVSPTLSDTIANFDYFMVKKSEGGNATDGLVNAWNAYKTLTTSLIAIQTTNITQLKTYQNELLALNYTAPSTVTTDWTQYGLTELNTQKTAYTVTQSNLLSNGAGSTTSPQYAEYLAIANTVNAIQSEIIVRTNQITAKQAQITTLNTTILSIANQLSYSNNFTDEQIKELYSFYRESEYTDSTYVVADTDSEATKLEIEQQLYDVASTELARVSQPQYNIDTTLNNLFALPEFSNYHEGFSLGNIITIKFSNTLIATARLLSIKINFNKLNDISVVFANRNKLDNSAIDLKKIISQANSTSNAVSVSGLAWDKAASKTSEISAYMTSALNTAVQEIKNSDDEEVTFGKYGIRLKGKNEATGIYDQEETWITKNKLLFSTDNFNSAISGIGKFVSPVDGNTYYGFMGEAIVSKINITSALTVSNENNTITLNKDGATFENCSIRIIKGTNTLTLNATDGIKLTKDGVSQFGIDANGNATFGGILYAATGTFSGSLNAATGSFSGSLNAATGTFAGTLSAGISITSPVINGGNINGSIFYSDNGLNQGTKIENGMIETAKISVKTWNSSGAFSDIGTEINATTISMYKAVNDVGFSANAEGYVICEYINGSVPILENTKQYYSFKPESHLQSSYTIQLEYDASGNSVFYYGATVATPSWCFNTFEQKSPSDFRLKKNIRSLDELPDELYYSLKPKLYQFKCLPYNTDTSSIGLLAQEIISAFSNFSLDAFQYGIVEYFNARQYTDECMYTLDGKLLRVNYEQFTAWTINIIHKQQRRILNLESSIYKI